MNSETFNVLHSSTSLGISSTYVSQAEEARKSFENAVRHLIQQRKLPATGFSWADIEQILRDFARMDSNNFPSNCGVGEREARIYSDAVYRRNFGLCHGIGRSGDLTEVQPKAAGSSLLNRLTNELLLDLIRQFGVRSAADCFLVPVATGMALTLCMLALRKERREAKYVLWSRIDQKSCFKSILAAGYEPVILEPIMDGDELQVDLEAVEAKIESLGAKNILCLLSTTSCFAPRAADDLPALAEVLSANGIPHLINNAYGVQSSKCMHLIQESARVGGDRAKLNLFVQSTDKNLMVPVGGAIIAGFNKEWVGKVSKTYPGRASAAPTIDVFISLLSMGVDGYKKLVAERKENFKILKTEMEKVAEKFGERVLETKNNPISIAMTLENVPGEAKTLSEIGSMLFTRGVSGTRVLTGQERKTIEGFEFECWGSHSNEMSSVPYLTAAAAIGMTRADTDAFIKRLEKVLESKKKKA